MQFDSVLMTFFDKSDEQIAYENFVEANAELKEIIKGRSCTEESIKMLMKKFLNAFWVYRAYDTDIAKDIATNIHSLGRVLLTYFGCKCQYDHEQKMYYSCCPAMLLHYDFGFSIRALVKYKCSICGKPIIDCDHLSDDFYDGVECWIEEGKCNICGKFDCRDHTPGVKYDHVQAYKIPYDMKLITFDMVHDPELKYARVTKIYYSEDEIKAFLPQEEFIYGESDLYCEHCLNCEGYNPHLFDSLFQQGLQTKH